ncbi:oligosaccharide flippase family protein [Patescibacteria group bacterium]|nr:oligosaccharide flippase family protein [Patescibacteria group bacterium]
MGYKEKVYKSIGWVGMFRFSTRIISILRTSFLARILTPTQFGIVGIAMLALSFVEILTETGINVFLVQKKEKINEYVDTAWIVSILRGFLVALIILVSALPVSVFFNSKSAYGILLFISLVPVIRGFVNPSVVLFQKDLRFDREFYFRSFLFIVDSVVAVSLAFIYHSVESIIFGLLASAILEVILSFALIKPIPRFNFKKIHVRQILNSGKYVTAAGIFNYLFQNLDNAAIGRMMGTTSLGFYSVAYKISIIPITEIADSIAKVTFPVYAKISGDLVRLRKAFINITLVISITCILFGLMLLFFTKELILIILGPQWIEVVPVIRALTIFGVIRAISGSSSALFLAIEKQKYVMYVTLVSVIGLGITIIPLVKMYGLVGAAIAATIGSVLAIPVIVYFLIKTFTTKENRRVDPSVYTQKYYLTDCTGFEEFKKSYGKELEPRFMDLIKFFKITPESKLLDIGCGRGEMVLFAAKQGAKAIGIDYSKDAIVLSNKLKSKQPENIKKNMQFLLMDSKKLSFKDSFFDMVILTDVVEHLYPEELDLVFAEIRRVLKAEGLVVIHTAPNKLFNDIFYKFYSYPLSTLIVGLWNLFTGKKYPNILKPSSLRTESHLIMHVNEPTYFSLKKLYRKFKFKGSIQSTNITSKKTEIGTKDKLFNFVVYLHPLSKRFPFNVFSGGDFVSVIKNNKQE